jgi:hypothetical protein
LGDDLACATISLSPTEELAMKEASYARPTVKRKREGKDTEFEINGRLLPRQKMQRFMVRKELSEEDVIRSDARKYTSTSSRAPLLTITSHSSVCYISYTPPS